MQIAPRKKITVGSRVVVLRPPTIRTTLEYTSFIESEAIKKIKDLFGEQSKAIDTVQKKIESGDYRWATGIEWLQSLDFEDNCNHLLWLVMDQSETGLNRSAIMEFLQDNQDVAEEVLNWIMQTIARPNINHGGPPISRDEQLSDIEIFAILANPPYNWDFDKIMDSDPWVIRNIVFHPKESDGEGGFRIKPKKKKPTGSLTQKEAFALKVRRQFKKISDHTVAAMYDEELKLASDYSEKIKIKMQCIGK